MLEDLSARGSVSAETYLRVGNELVGLALDKLGQPFISEFEYELIDGCLVAENGQSLAEINDRSLDLAIWDAKLDGRLSFRVDRFRADKKFAEAAEGIILDPSYPEGSTLIAMSPCPDYRELGISQQTIEDLDYQPDRDMAMVWFARKQNGKLKLRTVNFFHADPSCLIKTAQNLTREAITKVGREQLPHQIILTTDHGGDIAERFVAQFDQIRSEITGQETFHGLHLSELPHKFGAEAFIDSARFSAVKQATMRVLELAARSLYEDQLLVDRRYLNAMLTQQKPDGTYELTGNRRVAVERAMSGAATSEVLRLAMSLVEKTAQTNLWAEMAAIYFADKDLQQSNQYSGSFSDLAVGSFNMTSEQRALGRSEHGCAGGGFGRLVNNSISLYELSDSSILSILFNPNRLGYSFNRWMHCVSCQKPPKNNHSIFGFSKKESKKFCGPCGLCRNCDPKARFNLAA